MFKELLKNRLFIGALVVFVLFACGCLLYLQHLDRQLAAEKARTAEAIKQWEARQKPTDAPKTAEVPVGDTSQGGHTPADGTWHAGAHAPVETPATKQAAEIKSPQGNAPTRSKGSHPRRLPEDVFSAEYTAQVKAAVQTLVSLFYASEDEQKAGGFDEAYAISIDARNDANRLSNLAYTTKNPAYQARADEIYALREPFDALMDLIPRKKLTADQVAQLEKAAADFDAILAPLRSDPASQHLELENPYRTRLEEETNR